MKNERLQFVWTHFSELNSYLDKQAKDPGKLNGRLAEMVSLLTCQKNSSKRKDSKCEPELKEILSRIDSRIRSLYAALPANAMLIICTGHGDTAIVRRSVFNSQPIANLLEFHFVFLVWSYAEIYKILN